MELNFREYVENTTLQIECLTITEQMEFERYMEALYGEGFMDLLKRGWEGLKTGAQEFGQQFKTSYGKAKDPAQAPGLEKKVVEMAKQAYPAAQNYSQKLGIPISLVLALIVSGAIGGPAAVPMTLVTYLVRKPLLKLAGKGFDIGAGAVGLGKKGEEPITAQAVDEPQMVQGKYGRTLMPTGTGTGTYPLAAWAMYPDEYVFIEAFEDWMKKIGGMAGKGIGAVAGTGRRYVGALANIVKTNVGAMIKFARENPVTVVKGLFLIAVGAAIGFGVRHVTQQASEAVAAVAEGGGNVVSPQEVQELAGQVGAEGAVGGLEAGAETGGGGVTAALDRYMNVQTQGGATIRDLVGIDAKGLEDMRAMGMITSGDVDAVQYAQQNLQDLGIAPNTVSGSVGPLPSGVVTPAADIGLTEPAAQQAVQSNIGQIMQNQDLKQQFLSGQISGREYLDRLGTPATTVATR
jgi:hypothetical protein